MDEQAEDFNAFKQEGVEFITGMLGCLRRAVIIGRAFSNEIGELESKVAALSEVSTREEWKTLVDSDINPLFDAMNNALDSRFGINIGYVLEIEGFYISQR